MQGFQEFLDVLMSFKPRPLELIEFLDYQFHVVDDFSGVPVLLQPPGVVQVPRRRSRELVRISDIWEDSGTRLDRLC